MSSFPMRRLPKPELLWTALMTAACLPVAAWSWGAGPPSAAPLTVAGQPVPTSPRAAGLASAGDRAEQGLLWRLNNPEPHLISEQRANPVAVVDKFAARVRSMEQRAPLPAYEGAPPVIPHAIADLNVQTCRACHAQGLTAGGKVARMVSHTYLTNCTQCHVEAADVWVNGVRALENGEATGAASGRYVRGRAWTGAPPVVPHTTFMRTNCVSCHGEHGYDGWRPDHLSRTNCVQCHVPAAEFDQLAPTFGVPDVADGQVAAPTP